MTKFPWKKKQDAAPKVERPAYGTMDACVEGVCLAGSPATQWYSPLLLSATAIASQATSGDCLQEAARLFTTLEPDDYTRYLGEYYRAGLERFGPKWHYADIVTVLLALAGTLRPKTYLEIGVRRGRSACAVASKAHDCDILMFDIWKQNYAGMENIGPDFVAAELAKVGHVGNREFFNGNSHQTLKEFFTARPDTALDIITVDGDHSFDGAAEDLRDVLPHLKVGGAIVFDDLSHPQHVYLLRLWREMVADDPRFTSWTYTDLGYGVGFALRKW
jgi:predicted O-methyltransferase YrrM